jgi:glycosyltransferase involved in cell wall biosynthesis
MSNTPLVSIGLPTYNRAATLGRAIESALNQHYQNIELLISDNASTDETEAICRDAVRHDKRVKYLRQQTNQGATANFRAVLRESAGEFFMWLADDDWLDQSYVGRCVQVLLERPDYSLVCGKARYFQDGKFDSEGVVVRLLQERASDRTLAYFGQVADNGTFYGVMRGVQARQVLLRNTMGGDWLYMAAVAFIGKVETLEDICVNRSLGGATASYKKIADSLGLSQFAADHPNLSIAASAFSDIVWRSTVYSKDGLFTRLSLGSKVFSVVARRGISISQVTRELAFVVTTKLLPAPIVDKIHNRLRRHRAEIGK